MCVCVCVCVCAKAEKFPGIYPVALFGSRVLLLFSMRVTLLSSI